MYDTIEIDMQSPALATLFPRLEDIRTILDRHRFIRLPIEYSTDSGHVISVRAFRLSLFEAIKKDEPSFRFGLLKTMVKKKLEENYTIPFDACDEVISEVMR